MALQATHVSKLGTVFNTAKKFLSNVVPEAKQKSKLNKFVLPKEVTKAVWTSCGFHKYGLVYHDCFNTDIPDIKEAVRRLPRELQDLRNYRQLRAIQCQIENTVLPKEQWTTFEECVNNRYLEPLITECEQERLEREKWERDH